MTTIVIPLYNKEKSILNTIQSVINQTYTDWELIIVDDGSSDESLRVVEDYIQVNSEKLIVNNIRVIHKENGGVSSARNKGVLEAKGEYVAFLDADDLWTTDYLETLAALVKDYPDAGLYFLGYTYLASPKMPGNINQFRQKQDAYRGKVNNPWNIGLDVFTGSCSSNRDRLIKIGMFDERMTHGEDLDVFWRLILDGGLVVDEKCCAFYRLDSENRAMHRVPPLDKHIPCYIDKYKKAREENPEFRRFFDEQMIYRLYPYLLDKRYAKEARMLARKLDYSQLKWSMHFRMLCPKTYYYLRKYFSK